MQQNGVDYAHDFQLTNEDIVATFPEGKQVVKRLLREANKEKESHHELKRQIRDTLSNDRRINMFDLDIATELVYAGASADWNQPGVESIDDRIRRLTRLSYLYEPPKETTNGISDADIQRAKEYPIRDLVKVRMNVTHCLFHDEKTPSMHVYRDNHAYCFGCHKYADAIDIAMALNNMDFVTAVKWLLKI